MWFFQEATGAPLPSADSTFDFSAALPTSFSLSRAGAAALGRNNTGRWVAFPADTPRSWYDPVTLSYPYTLIEPERTQLLFRTRQPTPTVIQSSSTLDTGVQTPFGLGSILYVPNTTGTTHGWNLFFGTSTHGTALADNTTVAMTAVLKPTGAYTDITFLLLNRTGIYSSVRVSLQGNGTVVSSAGIIHAEVNRDTDEFYNVTIINNFGAGTTTAAFNAGFHDQTGSQTFAGDGVSGFYLAYIGAEIGTEATSPIINAGTNPLARPADILTASTQWLETGSKTFGLTYVPLGRSPATILNISGTDQIDLRNGLNTVSLAATVGGQQTVSITASSPVVGIERTVVFTLASGSSLLTQDGLVVGSDNSGASVPNALSLLRLGSGPNGLGAEPMRLRLLKYWSEALSQDAAVSYSDDLTQEFTTGKKTGVTIQPTMTITASSDVVSLLVVVTGDPVGTTVTYGTVNGTALAGVDYVGGTGSLTIPVGEMSGTITISLMPRGLLEDKTFKIALSSATGAAIANGVCDVLLLRKVPEGGPASTKLDFGPALPEGLTLTRASPAWTRNSTGVWTQVAANTNRQHFVSPGNSGLLLEPAAAQQCLFDSIDPAFLATGGTRTIVTNGDTPTGSKLIQFREATATGQHKLATALVSGNSAMPTGQFTTSILIRPVTRTNFLISVKAADNVTKSLVLTLSGSGTVTTAESDISWSIEADPFRSQWYWVALCRNQFGGVGVTASLEICSATSSGDTVMAGSTGSGFDIAHLQIEAGSLASSPIIVTAAAAATVRAADVLKASGTWYQRQSYSLGVRFRRLKDSPENQRLWMAKDVVGAVNGVSIRNGLIDYDLVGEGPPLALEMVASGVQTTWELPDSKTDAGGYNLIIAIDGVSQSNTAYTLTGNTLVFSEPPPSGSLINIRAIPILSGLMESLGTGNQTSWILPVEISGSAASLLVAVDGIIQAPSSYGVLLDQLILSEAPPVNAIVSIRGLPSGTLAHEAAVSALANTITMPISVTTGVSSVIVSVDGVIQPVSAYSVLGTQLAFPETPRAGSLVDIRFLG